MASVPDAPEKLVSAALEIQETPAKDAGKIGYITSLMAQASLPHRDPKTQRYIRRNGDIQIFIDDPTGVGIPYGSIPRLTLAWVITEAFKKKNKELILGDSINQFLRELDIIPSGGKRGSIIRVQKQIERLFNITLTIRREDNQGQGYITRHARIVFEFRLWTGRDPNQTQLWENAIILTDEFYKEIIDHPVPFDLRVLRAIKQSPMAIDIYLWRTYRNSYLKKETPVSWEQLQLQFGANYANNKRGRNNFQQAYMREQKRVVAVYPGAKVKLKYGRVILIPCKPSVPKSSTGTCE